jgi:hypothetical protein
MTEITINTCRDCGDTFPLTPGEVDFYAQRGLVIPKRCKPCRDVRRAERAFTDNGPAAHPGPRAARR